MNEGVKVILLVEDEEKLRHLLKDTLTSNGFRVLSASNGQEGLDAVADQGLNDIDLILTDVIMPQMSGKQMADKLKPMLPKAKVIFMSGYTDDQLALHGVLSPDIELIEKPFLAKNLVKRINEIACDER